MLVNVRMHTNVKLLEVPTGYLGITNFGETVNQPRRKSCYILHTQVVTITSSNFTTSNTVQRHEYQSQGDLCNGREYACTRVCQQIPLFKISSTGKALKFLPTPDWHSALLSSSEPYPRYSGTRGQHRTRVCIAKTDSKSRERRGVQDSYRVSDFFCPEYGPQVTRVPGYPVPGIFCTTSVELGLPSTVAVVPF
eukprot:443570-Rhodomonas_salina.1